MILYTSAHVLWKSLDAEIGDMDVEDRPIKTNYVLEKLSLFISYFNYAAIPVPGADKTPQYWLHEAGVNLMKVEIEVKDFE